jgi:hypothetical protein
MDVCARIHRRAAASRMTRAVHMSKSACAQCTACFELHVGMRCCFARMLYVHVAYACILSCGVLRMPALSRRYSLTALGRLHVAMVLDWCVQDLRPQPGTRGSPGRDCKRGGGGMGGTVSRDGGSVFHVMLYMWLRPRSISKHRHVIAMPLALGGSLAQTCTLSLTHLLTSHTFIPLAICPADSSRAFRAPGGVLGYEQIRFT